MKITASFYRRYRWINVPTATLVALLQRSPIAQVVQVADEMIKESPVGFVLKSSVAAAATLGAMNSLAGATTLVSSPLTTPVSATVGVAISTTAITVNGTQSEPGSWTITTAIPAGLAFSNSSGTTRTGAGNIDVPNGVLFLSGTPTVAGTYNVGLIAYEFAEETGVQSPTYTFTIVVSASSSAPSFTVSPESATTDVGQSVSFTAAASGSPTYAWQKNGSPIPEATSATYTLSSPQPGDAGSYSVIATNGSGSTTSAAATLTVVSTTAAPVFTSQPLTQPTVDQGVTVNFNATAVGGTVSYQWEFGTGTPVTNGVDADGNTYSGATTSSLVVVAQTGSVYKVVATNINGSTTSSSATLTVASAGQYPVFTTQPLTQSALVGQTVNLTAIATNAATYQWYLGANQIFGQTSTTLTFDNVQVSESGTYSCVATTAASQDVYGDTIPGNSTTSASATLTVTAEALPVFTTQPAGQTVNVNQSVTFTAAASGSPTYQWTFDGANLTGNASATTASLTLTNVQLSAIGTYAVVATNAGGPVTSNSVSLNVINIVSPSFTVVASPSTVTVDTGRSVAFNAVATGTPAPTYQWTLNNSTTIPGATNTTDSILLVSGATSANSGTYTCTATNSAGTATTSATLTVATTSTPAYLDNISARADVGTGGNILIGGFGLGGSGAMDLLLRGDGPLLDASLSGTLANPQLTMFDGHSIPIVTDIGWGNPFTLNTSTVNVSPQLATTALFTTLGAGQLTVGSADSALEVTPQPGGYTFEVSGVGGTTGIALAEIYDCDPPYSNAARLVNLSARANVLTGGNILIGGFGIGGASAETVLIRGLGPALSGSLNGTLAQPVVTIFSGSTPIYSNTGWADDSVLSNASILVGGETLSPSSQDSAMLVTLPPGGYTVEVTGVNSTTGVALFEIYEVY